MPYTYQDIEVGLCPEAGEQKWITILHPDIKRYPNHERVMVAEKPYAIIKISPAIWDQMMRSCSFDGHKIYEWEQLDSDYVP